MNIGEKIQKVRIMRGLTQQELGVKMHYNESTAGSRISQYELGKKTPTDRTIKRLADILDVDSDFLRKSKRCLPQDVIRYLFELEDEGYSIHIRKSKSDIVVEISDQRINSMLAEWKMKRERVKRHKDTANEYLLWKMTWHGSRTY